MEQAEHSDDEALSAWLDGELPQAEADRLTERLASEPALARRLEAMRSADGRVRDAFAALDDVPMPQSVLDLLGQDQPSAPAQDAGSNVVPFPRRIVQPFLQAPVAIAAAVALAAGFFVSGQMRDGTFPGGPADSLYAGDIPADSGLYALFETGESGRTMTLEDGWTGQPLLTFADADGAWCRQVAIVESAGGSATGTVHAVACRRDGGWQTEVLSIDRQAVQDPAGSYQLASSTTPPAVSGVIDSLIGAGAPLDAPAESALIDRGWQKNRDAME